MFVAEGEVDIFDKLFQIHLGDTLLVCSFSSEVI